VLGPGYHPETGGVLVTGNVVPEQVDVKTAVQALRLLFQDFDFATAGDESRAFASVITPALRIGGWLNIAPIDAIEANESQAGKTLKHALVRAKLNSDLPGEIKALVTANVYDTATGQYLLIPQGSRLIGAYDSNIAYSQESLQVVWHRIIYPDASSIDLGGMIGQDAAGASGFRHDVDRHYSRLIGSTILSSLFSAGFQLSQNRGGTILQTPTTGEIAANAVGQQVSQVGAEITRKNLNIQPTVKIPVGYRFNVRVNRDILFNGPYDPIAVHN